MHIGIIFFVAKPLRASCLFRAIILIRNLLDLPCLRRKAPPSFLSIPSIVDAYATGQKIQFRSQSPSELPVYSEPIVTDSAVSPVKTVAKPLRASCLFRVFGLYVNAYVRILQVAKPLRASCLFREHFVLLTNP